MQQHLDSIKAAIADLTNVSIRVVRDLRNTNAPDVRRISVEEPVGTAFHRFATDAIRGLGQPIAYDPCYSPEPHEVLYIDLSQDTYGLRDIFTAVGRLGQPAELTQTDGFLTDASFYTIVATSPNANDQRKVILCRKFVGRWQPRMRNKIALMAFGNQFKKVDRNLFTFDNNVDFLAYGDHLFIRHKPNFDSVFAYYHDLMNRAAQIITDFLSVIKISNSNDFMNICGGNVKMVSKINGIIQMPGFQSLTMPDLLQRNVDDNYRIPVETILGSQCFKFETDMSDRWKILNLVDEKIVLSQRSGHKFLTSSKKLHA